MYDGLDLPDEAFGDGPAKPTRQTAGYYRWVVVVMAALILLLLLGRWL